MRGHPPCGVHERLPRETRGHAPRLRWDHPLSEVHRGHPLPTLRYDHPLPALRRDHPLPAYAPLSESACPYRTRWMPQMYEGKVPEVPVRRGARSLAPWASGLEIRPSGSFRVRILAVGVFPGSARRHPGANIGPRWTKAEPSLSEQPGHEPASHERTKSEPESQGPPARTGGRDADGPCTPNERPGACPTQHASGHRQARCRSWKPPADPAMPSGRNGACPPAARDRAAPGRQARCRSWAPPARRRS